MNNSSSDIVWLKRYPVDTLQVYFAASLELQEELIRNGFQVPKSPDGRVSMPVPLIYSDFRGWLKQVEPITVERLIPPEWLELTPQELGWSLRERNGKKAYEIPPEEVYVNVGIDGDKVVLDLDVKMYHLERTSIRGVNPEKWTNWAMIYINAEYIDELLAILGNALVGYRGSNASGGIPKPQKEVQQNGKEITYFVRARVEEFSLCLGCFDLAQRYLYLKAIEHCRFFPDLPFCKDPLSVVSGLRLRLKQSPNVGTFAKVGVAKISGKRPQVMVKLASNEPIITIRGVLKDKIEGKARGELVYCNHVEKRQYMVISLMDFYRALLATKGCIDKLPKDT